MFVCAECGASQPGEARCAADGTPLSPIGEDLLLGTTIGAYRVARLLGIGGMGRVYKGVHPTIGSRVAIKVLSRECSDRRELVERFFSEAKAVNLIRHESIVNVLDLAMLNDGRPYIIMEYLDGLPLAAIVDTSVQRGVPLPLGGLARLAAEVLDALAAAHAKHIVHRDLKPDNIFVTPSGRPKVLDFGIAKLNDLGSGSATRTGSLLGTPHYMSPEQAAGRPVDARADVYAMGVILFECATGHKPFTADSLFDLLRKHVESPPPSPRALRHDMPPELEHVILTALAKPADQRFASAQAMSMALQHATQHLPPDQWTPITAVGSPSMGGWAPTQPASWSGRGSHASQPPPTSQAPILGQAPTVTAGEVPARTASKPGSGKGVWIAIAAIVLVGGGVTAAVLAGGGTGGGSNGDVATTEPAKTEPAKTEPAKTEPAKTEPAKTGDDNEVSDEDMKEAYALLDEQMKHLPPEEQKRLAKYKDLAKLTPKERAKKLGQLNSEIAESMNDLGAINNALGGAGTTQTPGAWVTRGDLPSPSGFNAKHLDVGTFIPYAIALAKKAVPDAELYRIDSDGVSPDGFADLTLPTLASDHGSIDLRFISASHSKRDPKIPAGVPAKRECEFRIEAEPGGVSLSPMFATDCKEKPIGPPKCGHGAIWKKAIGKGAPSSNAVGNLGYRSDFGGHSKWYFDIGFGTEVTFSEMFNDDC